MTRPDQSPSPGSRLLRHRGDTVELTLRVADPGARGSAWVRCNIGRAAVHRSEIIRHVELGDPILHQDWRDLPMRAAAPGVYALTLDLSEVGVFEAKAFFLPEHGDTPLWPEGPNVIVKVEPAGTVCGNSIYNTFVRQFGPRRFEGSPADTHPPEAAALEREGFTVIPPSGTFRQLASELPVIIDRMGFRILLLMPVFPTPTTYARMGRFGSPYAALDFESVDPALAEFDRRTTPLDQFRELVDAVHSRRARLMIDIPVNHTGWASRLQAEHPEWFVRNADRSFVSPGAWGVTWEDLSKLDYHHRRLWTHMAGIFLHWCRLGVDGFRCDAGYMIPAPVWEYITAKVREQYPDTLFFLEGLGGHPDTVRDLLGTRGMNWAYSELFQNYDQNQIAYYLPGCLRDSFAAGIHVHFAETHDNNRLAAQSLPHARLRTALSALFSHDGGWGITNGVEWFCRDKIFVHDAPPLNWGAAVNQVEEIRRLNAILDAHPTFRNGVEAELIQHGHADTLALLRRHAATDHALLILVNLNENDTAEVRWPVQRFGSAAASATDLLSGRTVPWRLEGDLACTPLAPAGVLCLSTRPEDGVLAGPLAAPREPEAARLQRARALLLDLRAAFGADHEMPPESPDAALAELLEDPAALCAHLSGMPCAPVVRWTWPEDTRRVVPVPPGHAVWIEGPDPFDLTLRGADGVTRLAARSIERRTGTHFTLAPPLELTPGPATLAITVYRDGAAQHADATLLILSEESRCRVSNTIHAADLDAPGLLGLCTNEQQTAVQARAAWGRIESQYDALLSAPIESRWPTDRRVFLTRCRAWLVHRGYSHELGLNCQELFRACDPHSLLWHFEVPAGLGRTVPLDVTLTLAQEGAAVQLAFHRLPARRREHLPERSPVRLIVRPDIEDRIGHEKTKAYAGAERAWPAAVRPHASGFSFAPYLSHALHLSCDAGSFTVEPEWQYMVPHPFEAGRGLDGSSDLFSPGYFAISLTGDRTGTLTAEVRRPDSAPAAPQEWTTPRRGSESRSLLPTLDAALRQFIVRRDTGRTVIAGYPWFLDWGRDTLIALRGIIAAGLLDEARQMLREIGRHEHRGTLPNLFRGSDASNRDTSDAPLWFFVACADLMRAGRADSPGDSAAGAPRPSSRAPERRRALNDPFFTRPDCDGRSLLDILKSLATGYIQGTPNGIGMDPDSALIFSPSHFTWMDTNFPAGTPREGYPIEIQALWHHALRLLARLEPGQSRWAELARQVESSILRFYPAPGIGLSDCIHAGRGTPARAAQPDDHLRPNQLLAITLGAVTAPGLRASILDACAVLLVPGAIRSLADRPVTTPLPVHHHGALLNTPSRPYAGRYEGDEDTRRKPAYHNGTAWTWQFPSYAEALLMTYGPRVRKTALALLGSSTGLLQAGCIGQIPELTDGDAPHTQRGCWAQAWGVSELYRVLALCLNRSNPG